MRIPELTATWPSDDIQALRRFEARFDGMKFDDLLDTATELYLKRPLEYTFDTSPLTSEAKIVQQLGTRGIRMLYEVSKGIEVPIYDDEITDKVTFVDVDSPYMSPSYFSEGLDLQALQKAEQFGAALTEQTFQVLGQDAYDKVREYKAARTEQEQLDILQWLSARISKLTALPTDNDSEDSQDQTLYNPIRLSPKAIGNYPNNRLAPTCLGVSILAASFFKRADVEYLHGGSMQTPKSANLLRAGNFLNELPYQTEILFGTTLPEKFINDTSFMAKKLYEDAFKNLGYHAALYVPLISGDWVQLDTNFDASTVIPQNESNELTKAHNFLKEMKRTAPGLEVTHDFGEYNVLTFTLEKMLRTFANQGLPEIESIQSFLSSVDISNESLPQRIFEKFVEPFFNQPCEDEILSESIQALRQKIKYSRKGSAETLLSYAHNYTFQRYILNEMDIEQWVHRCTTDRAFLERRISDIQRLPLMICGMMALAQFPLSEEDIPVPVHPAVEIGLPDTRIGLSVLSDLAVYTEESPSATFWLSNWPSLVPNTEVLHLPETEGQYGIIENNLSLLRAKNLIYLSSYGIVRSNSKTELESEQQE